jgi:DNA-binding transcriptional regulator YhcF (GntR family)
VAAYIRDRIRSGELRPGDQLPTVTQLAAELAVGRASVSRALRALEAEGLIVTRARWASWVAEQPETR